MTAVKTPLIEMKACYGGKDNAVCLLDEGADSKSGLESEKQHTRDR